MTFKELIASDKPVIIDFFAEWCGPCKAFAPVLQDLKKELGDSAQIVKIDVDKNQELSVKMQVNSIPTVMIFQNGDLKFRERGAPTKQKLKNEIFKLTKAREEKEN